MKIKEIYIRKFGKLIDYKLSFSDGMNVVFGNNEAGKTTIFNFILAMLYGFSNTRGKGISDSARKKYMTWGENRIGGTMTVEHNGTTYVIDRVFGKTKAGDSLELTNLTLGETINLPNGKEVGEYLFDLDEKSFRGTCFIGQLSKDDVCDNDSVKTKLSNLSSAGDAEYSFDDVFGRLKNASLEIIRKTSTGKIYPLEIKKNELESRNRTIESELRHISLIDDENKALEDKRSALSSKALELEATIIAAKKHSKAKEYKNAVANNAKIETLRAEYERSAEAITRKGLVADRDYVNGINSLMKKCEDARTKCEYEENALENEKKTLEMLVDTKRVKKKNASVLPLALGGVVIVLAAVLLYFVLKSIVISGIAFGVGVVLVVCAFFAGNNNEAENHAKKDVIIAQTTRVDALSERVEQLKKELATCYGEFAAKFLQFFEYEDLTNAQENINNLALMIDRSFEAKIRYDAVSATEVSQEVLEQMRSAIDEGELRADFVSVNISELEAQRAMIANEITSIEKTLLVNKERAKGRAGLQTELEDNLSAIAEINEKINFYQYAGECLELAKQGVENAQAEMQKQFAPDVSKRVSEILSDITCGKYEQMTINNNLNTMVVDAESGAAYDDGYMSAGTLDQIYLALRLAIIKLIFAEREYPVICMDDALLSFDYSRMEKACRYISGTLAEKAQVLFFTCRDTEKACFSGANLINV